MSETVIKLENISKQYRLGTVGTQTIKGDLQRWWYRMTGKDDPTIKIGTSNKLDTQEGDYVWALKDINLEIKQGEVLGIIGKNGAGKSTLLKLLSRVTGPTTGEIKVKGRIASLLEVGTGFHPELTGRENIFLNGAILGMSKSEIKQKFDEIVDFAGVAKYINTPVKRYSSGMYVRLAFAVAAHLEPDILVVDEVLAVGDAEFQKKAIGKMQDVSTKGGRTVLFVSHNMGAVRNLCQRGILLKNGIITLNNEINTVVDEYLDATIDNKSPIWRNDLKEENPAKLKTVKVVDEKGDVKSSFFSNEDIIVKFDIESFDNIKNIKIGFDLMKNNHVVYRSQQVDSIDFWDLKENQKYIFECKIPANTLNNGTYGIRPLFSIHCSNSLLSLFDTVLHFNVKLKPVKTEFHAILNESNHPGLIYPILKWYGENT